MHKISYLVVVLCGVLLANSAIAQQSSSVDVDWPAYIAEQDMHWKSLPDSWADAPFVGNGMIGSKLFQQGDNSLVVQLGRSDIQDRRHQAGISHHTSVVPSQSRMPIGYFTIDTQTKITAGRMRLNLWDAEINATLVTESGEIELTAIVHSERDLLIVDAKATSGKANFSFAWHPEKAFCPRVAKRRIDSPNYHEGYLPNPDAVFTQEQGLTICLQRMLAGGETASAFHIKQHSDTHQTLIASSMQSWPEPGAKAAVVTEVKQSIDLSFDELQTTHRSWWHHFYPASFISLPDHKLESFFWAQNYKMACATRRTGALADNQGPWLQPTSWPALWWNLNVQLAYSHMLPANHPELSMPLVEKLNKHKETLAANAPEGMRHDSIAINSISGQSLYGPILSPKEKPGTTTGNVIWAMHNCYMQYRYTMDQEMLRDKIYPLLKKSVNLYRHLLTEGADGKLHLPVTSSPEYPKGDTADCNYDLALLRWGAQALLDSAETLAIDDPLIPQWKDILERLVEYPTDENGWMIGADVPFATGHRHYSHLLMFYPLATIDLNDEAQRELALKSLLHWQSFPKGFAGYSYSGSSSMFSHLGDGDKAEQRLQDFLNDKILPNTFYREGANPVIETPPAAARSVEDMLIQSWGDRIRVFPAAPKKWSEIAFANLRTEGAFLVSASRQKGKTQFVIIKSLAGAPCRVETGIEGEMVIKGQSKDTISVLKNGLVEFTLPQGESVVLTAKDYQGDATIRPVAKTIHTDWGWGKPVAVAEDSPEPVE